MSQGTITDTITEVAYSVMDKLQNEPCALMQSASRNVSNAVNLSWGQSVQSRVIGEVAGGTADTYSVSMTLPEADSHTDTTDTFSLNAYNYFTIPINGEEVLHINNTDQPWDSLLGKYLLKGFRSRRNDIEKAGCLAANNGACRAYGTAGTTPFASNFNEVNYLTQIFEDNGVAQDGTWNIITGTSAAVNIRNLAQLQQVNTAGGDDLLRRGVILPLSGWDIRSSAGIQSHTKGTGTGYVTDTGTTYAIGTTTIHVDTGTGTILAGDVVTFAGDTHKYVVKTGFAGDGDGDIVLGGKGLMATLADGVAMTIGNSYTGNIAMAQDAMEFASRAPMMPPGGDAAFSHEQITDPLTGLVWDMGLYKGKGTNTLLVSNFTGWKVWNGHMIATLLG